MRISAALLWLIARIVPSHTRARWIEEWRAELQHGRRTMIAGALPDAWALRRLPPSQSRAGGRRPSPLHALDQDVRYALRGLLAAPGFVLGVVLSLAIGIGVNVDSCSFINAAVFRPFSGVEKQHELVRVTVGIQNERFLQFPDYADFGLESARDLTSLRAISGYWASKFAVSTGEQAWAVTGGLVSSNYFEVLGVRPAAGRFFVAAEDATAAPVVVISDSGWDRFFGRDSAAVGRTISVNGATLEVVGIAPAGFAGVRKSGVPPEIWVPLGQAALTLRDAKGRPARLGAARGPWFDYVGRRRQGVSLEQVQTEASVLARQRQTAEGRKLTATVSRVWLNDPAESAPAILGFMAIPLLVLAIACVNAANLMLARAARQARDWTVRLALGASRWRVVRQVLTEAILVAAGAAAFGFALGRWTVRLAASQVPVPIPVDWRVVFFTVAIALFTAVAFSLGPALGVTSKAGRRMAPVPTIAGASRSRARFALVALQAALSLGLLTTGAQFTRTVLAANPREALIPDPQLLVMTTIDVDPLRFAPEAGEEFYQRLIERVRVVPGVSAAGLSTPGLIRGAVAVSGARLWLPDSPPEGRRGFVPMQVTPETLPAIGMPMLQGRHFTGTDATTLRTVVVNQPFAKKHFGGAALGRTFRLGTTVADAVDVTVIGITDGIMKAGDQEPDIVYYPAPLGYQTARTLYIRIDRSGAFTVEALQTAVREIDPRVPLGEPVTLNDARSSSHLERRMLARGAAALGMLALVLAAFGLYSVVSYVVSLRRQEVGIRLALGAAPGSVVGMIVRQGLMPTLIGAALGAGAAAAAGKVIQSQLYGTSSADPLVFLATGLLMVVVMAVASWIPARQAGRVDPLQVLRTE